MPYCRKCGNQMPEGAVYCPNCGAPVAPVSPAAPSSRLELADWSERFIAWLIDFIIIQAILVSIRFLAQLMRWTWGLWPWIDGIWGWIPFVDLTSTSLVFFLYWTFMEGVYGQSIGKMAMKIRVTRMNGQPIDIVYAAVESLGKAFLLPIDLIIGWILYPTKRQRLFNYISGTIILRASR